MKHSKVIESIIAELKSGVSNQSELARKYKVAPSTVSRYARQLGLKLRTPGGKPLTSPSKRTERILNSVASIGQMRTANRFRISKQRVHQIVQRWNGT